MPPHSPNWKMAGSGEAQLMKSEKAVVTSAMKSGRADCERVQRTRCAHEARLPSMRSLYACCHVSCTTKMLSVETPVTTKSEQPAKTESGRWRSTTSTRKAMMGKESEIWPMARPASSAL